MANALATTDDGWNSVPATTSGLLRGQRMKLQQDGHYYLAKSTEPFSVEQDLVVVGVVTAWQRWQDKKIAETRVTLPGQSHPDRDELGFDDKTKWPLGFDGKTKSDPWKDCRFLHLANPRSAQEFTLVVDNYHGRDAIGVLKDQIRNARCAHPTATPIVKLAAEQRRTKYGSKIWRPLFVVVDWHMAGDGVRDIGPPQIEQQKAGGGSSFDDAIPFAPEWR